MRYKITLSVEFDTKYSSDENLMGEFIAVINKINSDRTPMTYQLSCVDDD